MGGAYRGDDPRQDLRLGPGPFGLVGLAGEPADGDARPDREEQKSDQCDEVVGPRHRERVQRRDEVVVLQREGRQGGGGPDRDAAPGCQRQHDNEVDQKLRRSRDARTGGRQDHRDQRHDDEGDDQRQCLAAPRVAHRLAALVDAIRSLAPDRDHVHVEVPRASQHVFHDA